MNLNCKVLCCRANYTSKFSKKFKDYEYIFIFIIGWIFAKIWQFLIFSSARLGISVRIYDVFCSAPLWWKKNNCYRAINLTFCYEKDQQFGLIMLFYIMSAYCNPYKNLDFWFREKIIEGHNRFLLHLFSLMQWGNHNSNNNHTTGQITLGLSFDPDIYML